MLKRNRWRCLYSLHNARDMPGEMYDFFKQPRFGLQRLLHSKIVVCFFFLERK